VPVFYPQIYDKSIANPMGAIWSGVVMLDFPGQDDAT